MSELDYAERLVAARSALEAGRLQDAEQGFARLQRDFPDRIAGLEGLAQTATAASDWILAWNRWTECVQSAPFPRVGWLQNRAWAAFNLQQFASAQEEFLELARLYPQHHSGFFGQALVLTRLEKWEAAAAAWAHLFMRFPDARSSGHLLTYSQCLEQIGKLKQAVTILDDVGADDPTFAQTLLQKAYLLLRSRRPAEALVINAELLELRPDDFDANLQRLAILAASRRTGEAQQTLSALLALATKSSELTRIFEYVPVVFDGWNRTAMFLSMQERLVAFVAAANKPATRNTGSLALRLKLALRDRAGFLEGVNAINNAKLGPTLIRLKKCAAILDKPVFQNLLAPKVFGIGLSKTGTMSLVWALESLGYHAAHYINDLTREILKIEDALMFDAMADSPVCTIFESLYHLFSNSKFIYTVRPRLTWSKSLLNHFERYYGISDFPTLRATVTKPEFFVHRLDVALLHGSLYYHYEDAAAAYAAYDQRVRSFFGMNDPKRLLVFDVEAGDGWEKLCAFLGKDVPDIPFPWANKNSSV